MDRSGADVLRRRIEEQEHWSQATAVQAGRQARSDPDREELRELGSGVRLYGFEQRHEVVDGHRALVTWRVCKRLRQGYWERDLIREHSR
ncbi:MAG: hypothetical protein ACXVRI_05085 [Gaiellaceae bacterium]